MASCHIPVKQFPIVGFFFFFEAYGFLSHLSPPFSLQNATPQKQQQEKNTTQAPTPFLVLMHLRCLFFGKLWKASAYQQHAFMF